MLLGVMPPTGKTAIPAGSMARHALREAVGPSVSAGNSLSPSAPARSAANASLGVATPGRQAMSPAALAALITSGSVCGITTSRPPASRKARHLLCIRHRAGADHRPVPDRTGQQPDTRTARASSAAPPGCESRPRAVPHRCPPPPPVAIRAGWLPGAVLPWRSPAAHPWLLSSSIPAVPARSHTARAPRHPWRPRPPCRRSQRLPGHRAAPARCCRGWSPLPVECPPGPPRPRHRSAGR